MRIQILILGFKGLMESILGRTGERVASLVCHTILPKKNRERMHDKALEESVHGRLEREQTSQEENWNGHLPCLFCSVTCNKLALVTNLKGLLL